MLCGSPGLPCWTTVPAELTDTVPSLFIAGQWDPTALPCLVRRMFRAVRAPKLLLEVRRGDHAVANGPGSPMSLALTLTRTLTRTRTLTLTLTLTMSLPLTLTLPRTVTLTLTLTSWRPHPRGGLGLR